MGFPHVTTELRNWGCWIFVKQSLDFDTKGCVKCETEKSGSGFTQFEGLFLGWCRFFQNGKVTLNTRVKMIALFEILSNHQTLFCKCGRFCIDRKPWLKNPWISNWDTSFFWDVILGRQLYTCLLSFVYCPRRKKKLYGRNRHTHVHSWRHMNIFCTHGRAHTVKGVHLHLKHMLWGHAGSAHTHTYKFKVKNAQTLKPRLLVSSQIPVWHKFWGRQPRQEI